MWKRFQFFDKEDLRPQSDAKGAGGQRSLLASICESRILCADAARGYLACASSNGDVLVLDRDMRTGWKIEKLFNYTTAAVRIGRRCPLIWALGTDEEGPGPRAPVVKIVSLDKLCRLHPKGTVVQANEVILRTQKLFSGTKLPANIPITAYAVAESFQYFAIGLRNGTILLYRGDFSRAHDSRVFGHRGPKVLAVADQDEVGLNMAITNLWFRGEHTGEPDAAQMAAGDGQQEYLYATTLGKVLYFRISPRYEHRTILDGDDGAGPHCAALAQGNGTSLVVARDDAVFYYDIESDRGRCYAFQERGKKRFLSWHRGYLVVVTDEPVTGPSAGLVRGTSRSSVALTGQTVGTDGREIIREQVLVYDLQNRLVAFSSMFPKVVCTLSEWGSICVVSRERKGYIPDDEQTTTGEFTVFDPNSELDKTEEVTRLYQLDEKDTPTKLEMLFRKNMYAVAISLAHGQKFDDAYITDIFRKYGDHLYATNNFEGAMAQYIRTIGKLEPSYVIRRFLDAQRIHHLTAYLEQLHEKRLANADHTTLLLNCYTRLKDVKKLDHFIRHRGAKESKSGSKRSSKTVHFDLQTAIRVCRQAGYHTHALYLAEQHGEHDWYLKIQLEDIKDYSAALDYIHTLPFFDAEKYLKKYGKTLVKELPERTTSLLMELCTSYQPTRWERSQRIDDMPSTDDDDRAHPTKLGDAGSRDQQDEQPQAGTTNSSSLLTNTKNLINKLTLHGGRTKEDVQDRERNALFASPSRPSTQSQSSTSVAAKESEQRDALFASPTRPTASVPKVAKVDEVQIDTDAWKTTVRGNAEDFIHAFVDQPEWLLHFLEYIATHQGDAVNAEVYDTLLELYLSLPDASKGGKGGELQTRQEKILQLLQSPSSKYDEQKALVLTLSDDFQPGTLYLYERLGMYSEILRFYMEQGDTKNIIQRCKQYGENDPNLWIQVLSYFADVEPQPAGSEGQSAEKRSGDDRSSAIREVLQYINEKNLLPPLLVIQILGQNENTTLGDVKDFVVRRLQQEHKLIAEDQSKVKQLRMETTSMVHEIEELRTTARVFQSQKCTLCSVPLELPAVHFLCTHSFHQRCLADGEKDCPVCGPRNRKILEVKKTFEEQADAHDQFFRMLENASDGFTRISEYFGRGIFRSAQHAEQQSAAARSPPGRSRVNSADSQPRYA